MREDYVIKIVHYVALHYFIDSEIEEDLKLMVSITEMVDINEQHDVLIS